MPYRRPLATIVLVFVLLGTGDATVCPAQVHALPPNVAASGYAPAYVPGLVIQAASSPAAERPGPPAPNGGSLASTTYYADAGPAVSLPSSRVAGPLVPDSGQMAGVWSPSLADACCDSPGTMGFGASSSGRRYLQILPDGLMFPAYLAGQKESRMASQWVYIEHQGWMWDVALGGRAGILRWGTDDPRFPQGWQIDIEGAAFPRLNLETGREMESTDFRFGVPWTARHGRWEYKFGYYHLSSHLGDEFMVTNNTFDRVNYVRDSLVAGVAVRPHRDVRVYGEVGWGFYIDGGAEPWEFQFGADYSPTEPTGVWGSPFAAINGHLREEVEFGGHLIVQAGWQWRGQSGHLFRVGAQYFNGESIQYQFFDRHEEQLGVGLWYDY